MKLIGINGFKTAGKDTAYGFIKELTEPRTALGTVRHRDRVERRAFADNLKIMAMLALGFEYEESDEELIALADTFKENGTIATSYLTAPRIIAERRLTGRQYLQWFGGHARTVFGDGFWVNQVLPETGISDYDWMPIWGTLGRKGPKVCLPAVGCITDVRYPNEAERVLALGGETLEIVRPGLASDGHSSEVPLPRELISHTIVNDGSPDDLRDKISDYLDGTLQLDRSLSYA